MTEEYCGAQDYQDQHNVDLLCGDVVCQGETKVCILLAEAKGTTGTLTYSQETSYKHARYEATEEFALHGLTLDWGKTRSPICLSLCSLIPSLPASHQFRQTLLLWVDANVILTVRSR